MRLTYRDARPQDAAAIGRIFDTSFCDTFAHLYKPEDLEMFMSSFSIADWERQLRDTAFSFRLAETDGEPIGYLKLGPMKLPIEPRGPAILLDQLYILKEHHGSGIAHALMDWSLDQAAKRAAREMYLTVYTDNHRARRFYDRYGFEAVGRYEFMVGNHADEDIIMRKML
ncbi:MAG TPA: GNAT family N-acetyltransferase [Sphingomicrobium sp.]|nr:GNAT family N-acetyltransferase [Sphingomicrobium sp.]